MIDSQNKPSRCQRLLTVLVLCCIAAYLVVFAVMNFRGFARFCDPDMYGDTIVAKLMWEYKTLFPDPWCFGNQYYVVATPVLAAFFYGLTGNTNTAMVLATEAMTLLLLVSFFWMFRAVSKKSLPALVGCLMLIASIVAPHGVYSRFGVLFYLQASYYACYIITMFVVFGDYIRAFQSSRIRPLAWGLSLLLSFATGMQSIRQTVIMVLPILAYEVFLALRRMLLREKPWNRENLPSLIRALSYGAANAAGLVFIKLLHIPQVTIYGSLEASNAAHFTEAIGTAWRCFTQVSGLEFVLKDYPLVIALLALFWIAVAVAAVIIWVKKIKTPESALEICWLLCLIGIAGVTFASIVLNIKLRSIYIFMWFPLVAFSGLMILEKLSRRPRCLAILLVCIISLTSLSLYFLPNAKLALEEDTSDAKQLCQWAMDEGYEYVYGRQWVVTYIAVHSDGDLIAGYWYDDTFRPLSYCNPLDIYDEEDNAKAIYVFDSQDRDQALSLALEKGVALNKVAEFGDYTAYTSPVQLCEDPWN